MEAEPHQVRVRRPGRKATRLHRKQPGHRSQPNKNQCYQIHEATQVQEGSDEAYRVHGGPEPVHQPSRRHGSAFFKLLRKSDKFEWSEEATVAFQQLLTALKYRI